MESQHWRVPVLQVELPGAAKAVAARAKTTASLENIVTTARFVRVMRDWGRGWS